MRAKTSATRRRGKRNQRKGKSGEKIAELLLRSAGVEMVEQIATPYNVIATKAIGGARWVRLIHTSKVSGDRRGILANGRRVLCEVKVRDGNLQKSAFEEHQIKALDDNHHFGGVSLVAWIHPDDNLLLRWPFLEFEKERASVKLDVARDQYVWDGRS